MPVPVPRHSKPVAHPVVKKVHCSDNQQDLFQSLTRTLPVSPVGPPPSFGTRAQWINSLPSWRRTKPRRIWEDEVDIADRPTKQGFCPGLTVADNATVIKGAHAEACIPPLCTLLAVPRQPPGGMTESPEVVEETENGMNADRPLVGHDLSIENHVHWPSSLVNADVAIGALHLRTTAAMLAMDVSAANLQCEQGAFTPIFEDQSPVPVIGQVMGSGPLEHITPFAEYVDRAVAAAGSFSAHQDITNLSVPFRHPSQGSSTDSHSQQMARVSNMPNLPREPSHVQEVTTPSPNAEYKRLAEPLADWVANYVWKICTTGLSLPPPFSRTGTNYSYSSSPPNYLSASVHSLLLSTLLQPSAVFLAIWYIVRLPVYFNAASLGTEYARENCFRRALLGERNVSSERENMEASAPFRLIILGCMLANKWLDDHTFSNKTWHNISSVPIQALNKLESLTLDIFAYDLSVPSREWSQWLAHVMSYHMALASPAYPQPISRPSSNPHLMIRKVIDEIIQAQSLPPSPTPQPVFIGLEERRREKLEKELLASSDVLEIDLDEDGPLREEYLPRRRTSIRKSVADYEAGQSIVEYPHVWKQPVAEVDAKVLPPPAKWSPAGDEPILRQTSRGSGQYVAVQPPLLHGVPSYHTMYPPQPPPIQYGSFHSGWNTGTGCSVNKQQPGFVYEYRGFPVPTQPLYNPYLSSISISHCRSQSLSYEQEISQPRHHMRSYSQARFVYSEANLTATEIAPACDTNTPWFTQTHYPYSSHSFQPHPSIGYASTWLRT